jgi:Rad3-related DNA helicase
MADNLPQEYAKYAAKIAAANPTAFATKFDAYRAMKEAYSRLNSYEAIYSSGTGGFVFYKDGDGNIDLLICPSIVWRDL